MQLNGALLHTRSGEKLHEHDGVSAVQVRPCVLDLPGANLDRATTPSRAALEIVGDIDIRVYDVTAADWTPTNFDALIAKQVNATVTGGPWWFGIASSTGNLYCEVGSGTSAKVARQVPFNSQPANGETVEGLRFTWRQSDGRVQFFRLIADMWEQQGSDGVCAVGSLYVNNAPIEVGASRSGLLPITGSIGRAEVRDGIDGTIVASPDFTAQDPGTTSFEDFQGNVWSINGSAQVVAA